MKAVKKFLLIITTTLMISPVFADSTISLGGGTIAPRETLSIPLDKLVAYGSYNLVCQIADANNDKNKVMMAFNVSNFLLGATLNGKYIGATPTQGKLTSKNNKLEISEIGVRYGTLQLINLDQDDSVQVTSCLATPIGAKLQK